MFYDGSALQAQLEFLKHWIERVSGANHAMIHEILEKNQAVSMLGLTEQEILHVVESIFLITYTMQVSAQEAKEMRSAFTIVMQCAQRLGKESEVLASNFEVMQRTRGDIPSLQSLPEWKGLALFSSC